MATRMAWSWKATPSIITTRRPRSVSGRARQVVKQDAPSGAVTDTVYTRRCDLATTPVFMALVATFSAPLTGSVFGGRDMGGCGGPTRPFRWSWGPAAGRGSSRSGTPESPQGPGRPAIARSAERTGRCCSHTPAEYAGRAATPACLGARVVEGRSWNTPLRWAPGGFQAFAKQRMGGSATPAARETRLDAVRSVRLAVYRRFGFSPKRPIVLVIDAERSSGCPP